MFTGYLLEQALKNDEFKHRGIELVGMVKASEKPEHVGFSRSGCETWIDLAIDLIEQAEQIRQQVCKDHSHPVFRITLKEPKDPEAKLFAALLAAPAPNPSQNGPHHHAPPVPTSGPAGTFSPGSPFRSASMRGGKPNPTRLPAVSHARAGGFGFGGIRVGGGLNAWGCWESECCDCIEYECWYSGVEEINGGVQCNCVNWTCEPCTRCIWPY